MRGTAFQFLVLAILCGLVGMVLGIQMGIGEDFTLAPAHAHVNLVGWVSLALFAAYYRLTPAAAAAGLARLHLLLSGVGAIVLPVGIAISILSETPVVAIIGSLLTLAGMIVFLVTVLRHGFGPA